MILRRLVLENFRQFYGAHELTFGHSPSKNVSIVYAANGAGKTTLLNALTWVLYEELGSDFENPEQLINNRIWDECRDGSSAVASVTLYFDHNEVSYTLKRVHQVTKRNAKQIVDKKGEFMPLIYRDGRTGKSGRRNNPKVAIDQILPKRLHNFFFFNGERIDRLAHSSAFTEIESAIKTLLGLEILERGRRHLDGAIDILQQKSKNFGNLETRTVIAEIEELNNDKRSLENRKLQNRREIEALIEERDAVEEKLRSTESTRTLQNKRDKLKSAKNDILEKSNVIHNKIDNMLNTWGFLGFLDDLINKTQATIRENRRRGEIPTKYKRQFVIDRLEEGVCICGTKLVKGESSYSQVETWLSGGGTSDVEETFIELGVDAKHFIDDGQRLYTDISSYSYQLEVYRDEIQKIDEQLDQLSSELQELPAQNSKQEEDPSKLELRRSKIDERIGWLNREHSEIEDDYEEAKTRIKEKERERDKIKGDSYMADIANYRVTIATEVRNILIDVYDMRIQDVRTELDEAIKGVFGEISFKDYLPELSENFHLDLYDGNKRKVAKSTGENQILSLSFVGALANIAREQWRKARKIKGSDLSRIGFEGGVYPVVIDSAFGNLGQAYRKYVARLLPELTDQVIIFVSKSQGLGPVHEELGSKIGREFIIHLETPKQKIEIENLDLYGQNYPFVTRSKDRNENVSIIQID